MVLLDMGKILCCGGNEITGYTYTFAVCEIQFIMFHYCFYYCVVAVAYMHLYFIRITLM